MDGGDRDLRRFIVRRLVLALLATFLFASLYGQSAEDPPTVGTCTANALRIRSYPSLKEGSSSVVGALSQGDELLVLGRLGDTITIDGINSSWYAVVGMDGAIGWSCGGYLDIGTAKLRVFAGSDEEFKVESEASDALASEGGACRRLRASGGFPEIEAVFAKTAKGRPQIVYRNNTGLVADISVVGIQAEDYFGDASKELCVAVSAGAGDEWGRSIHFYSRSAQENRYAAAGVLSLDEHAGGGGWDMGSGSSVVEGPSPFIVGKNRYMRLVKEAVQVTPVEDRGDGIRRRTVEQTKFEELYALSGSKITLFKKTVYSVDKSEEELPSP
jgi:hypothetical protein